MSSATSFMIRFNVGLDGQPFVTFLMSIGAPALCRMPPINIGVILEIQSCDDCGAVAIAVPIRLLPTHELLKRPVSSFLFATLH